MVILNPSARRRWYDQKPELARCVGLLAAFPAEIQEIITDGLVELAEREFEAHSLMKSLKSLGPEVIMGIYKSKNKRRKIDEAPTMHKVMNYLYILSHENRLVMARATAELVGYIYQYFEACKLNRKEASYGHLAELTGHYVRSGGDEAQQFLKTLQQQFRQSIHKQSHPATPTLQDSESGMHLKKSP